jgi:Fe2+ transport system protein B
VTFNFDALSSEPPSSGSSPTDLKLHPASADAPATKRALLVGQPNVGKSVIFGALTGSYVTVSNYPGTTVEVARSEARFGEQRWEVVDTPGTHNLVPMSDDEAVTRDILLSERHDALVQVGDAKNLPRTLLLTLQIAELGVPFCLDLNMLDEARARGFTLDLHALARELPGVGVNASTATEGEGLDVVREYLATRGRAEDTGEARPPLACALRFPDDVEAAIAAVEEKLDQTAFPVATRGVATMLLSGEHRISGVLEKRVSAEARRVAAELAGELARAHGVPAFALFSRLRLSRARAVVRAVQGRAPEGAGRAHDGAVPWVTATAIGGGAAFLASLVVDSALARTSQVSSVDQLDDFGVLDVAARLLSPSRLLSGWHAASLALFLVLAVLATELVRRHARVRTATWKLVAGFGAGWFVCWAASLLEGLVHRHTAIPVLAGVISGVLALGAAVLSGDARDARLARSLERVTTHPVWGLPVLAVALLLAYKVVGVFGAGTAVDFVENRVFGSVLAEAALDRPQSPDAVLANDAKDEGSQRLVVLDDGPSRARVVAQIKRGGAYVSDAGAFVDVYVRGASTERDAGGVVVQGHLAGGEARIWSGHVNRLAYGLFAWLGVSWLTAFFVGPYGLLTMGVTYAVAIVLPVVATFFFVFSMLEDSGYLPRLAVMSNRILRTMGLNGKAVLPMVLGLGCDTMATLTARILETRKERLLVTLLLALAIPCSSQLSVIFALMQRTSPGATVVWVGVVLFTLFAVGWIAARALPGDKSDFLLEMPPLRQPMVSNILQKTLARMEWYLREAVPLFLAGTALLYVLDATHLLGFVHRAGEPVVHHLLGFPREAGVSDRVSEALLIGFLRRDFGAAGLLDLARAGHLSSADVAVSMVTITLFIPCIANVFMIAKERGWRTAGAMSAFIFPYAVAVGALVRLGFHVFGRAS